MADQYRAFINVPGGGEGQRCFYPVRLDPYGKGCAHNCSYCYARSLLDFRKLWHSREPAVADPGEIRKVFADVFDRNKKTKWAPVLKRRVPLRIGGMTDPLQPAEDEHGVAAETLDVLRHYRYPYLLVTKSDRIASEPILKVLDPELAAVQISVTTLSAELAAKIEQGAPPPQARLEALEKLSRLGFFVTGRLSPLFPRHPDGHYASGGDESGPTLEVFTWDLPFELCRRGAKCVLVEFLRFTPFTHRWLGEELGDDLKWLLNKHSRRDQGAMHFSLAEKRAYLQRIKAIADGCGVPFSVCDDADFEELKDLRANPDDCCNLLGNVPAFTATYRDS